MPFLKISSEQFPMESQKSRLIIHEHFLTTSHRKVAQLFFKDSECIILFNTLTRLIRDINRTNS
eukprot:UN07060